MTFTPEESKTPASIGDISVVLTDYVNSAPDTANYGIQVLQADDSLFCLAKGNLIPHLNGGQTTVLQDFMASVRVLAQGLLPA